MRARDAVDGFLELSIVGSFSRLGYVVRRRLYRWEDPASDALLGRTVLITGPTSGLGRATAELIAGFGARLVLVGRNPERLAVLGRELSQRYGPDRVATVQADMSSLASVRAAVARVLATEERLDVLIDNAGAIHPEREETDEGLEATFATMVAGPFVLIDGLLPLLEASGDGRVINVVSGGMYFQSLPLDDLQYERGTYDGTRAYARAKRASTALMREWSRRYRGRVHFAAMHPGWADTPGLAESLPAFYRLMRRGLRSPTEGADTLGWLASDRSADRPSGRLYLDRRPRPFDRLPATRIGAADRRRLWRGLADLVGVS
jgi:dehydrogenase/reductase SDR family protein 12